MGCIFTYPFNLSPYYVYLFYFSCFLYFFLFLHSFFTERMKKEPPPPLFPAKKGDKIPFPVLVHSHRGPKVSLTRPSPYDPSGPAGVTLHPGPRPLNLHFPPKCATPITRTPPHMALNSSRNCFINKDVQIKVRHFGVPRSTFRDNSREEKQREGLACAAACPGTLRTHLENTKPAGACTPTRPWLLGEAEEAGGKRMGGGRKRWR